MDSDTLYNMLGVQMYHYSYVFPDQVYKKVSYYKDSVSKQNCIDNYFNNIYLPWVTGSDSDRLTIENKYLGVHEFKPQIRGECRARPFLGEHPQSIADNIDQLNNKINSQLAKYMGVTNG
jgi:hypothetical protein